MPPTNRTARHHPGDAELFAATNLPRLQAATAALSQLFTRHGPDHDHAMRLAQHVAREFRLSPRQRMAVQRCACTDAARERRTARRCDRVALAGQAVAIDGFNVVITLESALTHALVLRGRDGVLRDLANVHGNYRPFAATRIALEIAGQHLHGERALTPTTVTWWLDRPVAAAAQLRTLIHDVATRRGWPWAVELAPNPDAVLVTDPGVIASSDAWVLDRCSRSFDLLASLLANPATDAAPSPATGPSLAARAGLWLLDLSSPSEQSSGIADL